MEAGGAFVNILSTLNAFKAGETFSACAEKRMNLGIGFESPVLLKYLVKMGASSKLPPSESMVENSERTSRNSN